MLMQFHNQYRLKNWGKKVQVSMETSISAEWRKGKFVVFPERSYFHLNENVKTDKVRTRTDAAAMSMLCNSASFKYSDIFILSR